MMSRDGSKPATILVVDDDHAVMGVLCDVLATEGYHVLKAYQSDEALDISSAYKEEIDLLITDVKMDPFMTGFELAQCLRLMRVEVKVLYISGFPENEMVRWEVKNGLATFLQKPFQAPAFLEKVRIALK